MIDDGPNEAREILARLERGDDPQDIVNDVIAATMQRMMDENPLTEPEKRLHEHAERRYMQWRMLARLWPFALN